MERHPRQHGRRSWPRRPPRASRLRPNLGPILIPSRRRRRTACGPGQVDINAAGFDALQEIIHIGPDRAEQIQQLRPFASVRAMDRISGIGPARLDDIIAQGVACAG
jgi:hypothetical protein